MSRLLCAAYLRSGEITAITTSGPIFYGEGARYFGVELESTGRGSGSDRACSW